MLNTAFTSRFVDDGLSDYDRAEVMAAASMLPGAWFAQFVKGSNGRSYACIGPSGGDGRAPAFLLERHDSVVVLTDRRGDQFRDLVTRHHSMTEAMKVVFAAVLAMTIGG